jgi:hypothetical protein
MCRKKTASASFAGGKAFIERSDLAAGIYFYRIVAADLSISGKIIAK